MDATNRGANVDRRFQSCASSFGAIASSSFTTEAQGAQRSSLCAGNRYWQFHGRRRLPCSSAFPPACAKCLSPGGGTTKAPAFARAFGDPAGARTQDPYIKSVMLYQLSYRIRRHRAKPDFEAAKVTAAPACTNTRPIITPHRRTTCTGSGLVNACGIISR